MMTTLLTLVALACYAAAGYLLVRALRQGRGPRNVPALTLGLAAVIVHALLLHGAVFVDGGLHLGFFHALSLAVWVLAVMMLLLAAAHPVDNLGIGLFPLAALALALDGLFGYASAGPTIATANTGLDVHILLSICAHGVLGLAAMQAILLGFQHRLLHDRQPLRAVRALPPLYVMESLLFRMIAVGFALLTAALASGFVYLDNLFAQQLVHKTVLTMAAWILFAVLLGGHHWAGWRGPTAVRFTLGGFALLVLGYFGSKVVLELILAPA